MVKVKLLDNEWMEKVINDLLLTNENITELEKDVCREKGYVDLCKEIKEIENMVEGSSFADILEDYREKIDYEAGYKYTAAYLNGIKTGFSLALFLQPSPAYCQPLKGQGEAAGI